MKRIIISLLAALLLTSGVASAQTYSRSTTLGAAVTSTSANVVAVASATGITANTTGLWVDNEFMVVNRVNGLQISVQRGSNGSVAQTHATSAVVVVQPVIATVSTTLSGSCTASNYQYLPLLNPATGDLWLCRSSVWKGTNNRIVTANSILLTP